ncbi:response regulator [Sneathiella sp. P13V-1]|uniref:hybrid sensor histidine kinase/response regulator n=1 Tax=Sneathiella sp. P13V-1 TaxID=2697366 RepID=UPI00187B5AD7|nr:chemotaxis protein CheW [Sneathiella sp. P13V-1]MBE7638563.1 response regulator [Sneathiella sp. P13V-1]
MDDLLSEFLTETNENIGIVDAALVALEQNPDDGTQIDNIFRLVHTIKGTCGFLGLPRLEAVAHAGENVLGKIRDGELQVTPDVVTIILEAMDVIKDLLEALEQTEEEPEGDDADLIKRLNDVAYGTASTVAAPVPTPEPEVSNVVELKDEMPGEVSEAELEAAFAAAPGPDDIVEEAPAQQEELRPGEVSLEELEAAFMAAPGPDDDAPALVAEPVEPEAPAAPTVVEKKAATPKANSKAGEGAQKESNLANQSIRVNVELLENLMTMVSELVLTRNQLLQMVRGMDDNEFTVPLQRLSHVTTELQEGLMKTRMQPIGNAWSKLPRIIRDLSHELGKKIDLVMHGAETELDRQVLEMIKDPLTHMVRNSADHGLEGPEERLAAGKRDTGRVVLDAYHEGGHIIITITDDGRGLNEEKIKAKVLENGLASEAELENMSTQQIHNFIMRAGFSTAEKVTNVSGRGVGMDVVKSNIEKIGGTIELKSEQGKGSTFTIKIPLTLAIVSALIVECGGERFAVPQISVVELVRASTDGSSENTIEMINDSPVLRLRDRLLPLVHLNEILRLETSADEVAEKSEVKGSEEFIIVTQVGAYTFGIVVDRVFDTEEIVVKPVAPILRHLSIFSGNTILGDGSVIMILDPNGIASQSGENIVSDHSHEEEMRRENSESNKEAMLICRAGGQEPKAVPLSLVARLEEIDVETIENTNGQLVVQYRGKIMPLVTMNDGCSVATEGRQPILVFTDNERTMGLVVDEIVDIVEDHLNVEMASNIEGMIGSAVIRGKATDIIDVGYFLQKCFGDWFGASDNVAYGSDKSSQRVLLVDDSPFFRNMLVPLLSVAGYEVRTAENPTQALDLRERGEQFDIIVSDIEMPDMDGFQFAEEVLKDERWADTPIIALSSHTTQQDFDRGRQVGFSDYVAKFDRDALMNTLSQTLRIGGGAK